jgi:hypothetical protein
MFSDSEEDGDDVVNEEKYEPSHSDVIPKDMLKVVKNLFDDHSLFDAPAHGRIMKITIVKRSPAAKLETKKDVSEVSKEASVKELAKQYTAYKLAALRYLEEQSKLDEETMFNALIQNR